MPKYYLNFNNIPNGKIIVDAKDEQEAVTRALKKMSNSSEEILEWCDKNTNTPLISITVSEIGFVEFPKNMEKNNDNDLAEW